MIAVMTLSWHFWYLPSTISTGSDWSAAEDVLFEELSSHTIYWQFTAVSNTLLVYVLSVDER